jgi:hypothetical protein
MIHAARAEAAVSAVAFSASQIRSRSPAVASNADALPLLTLVHCSQARLKGMMSQLKCPEREQW